MFQTSAPQNICALEFVWVNDTSQTSQTTNQTVMSSWTEQHDYPSQLYLCYTTNRRCSWTNSQWETLLLPVLSLEPLISCFKAFLFPLAARVAFTCHPLFFSRLLWLHLALCSACYIVHQCVSPLWVFWGLCCWTYLPHLLPWICLHLLDNSDCDLTLYLKRSCSACCVCTQVQNPCLLLLLAEELTFALTTVKE